VISRKPNDKKLSCSVWERIKNLVHYVGAIAILFLFVIMMIDIEVVENRDNSGLPLLLVLLISFVLALKNMLKSLGFLNLNLNKNENLELFDLARNNFSLIENQNLLNVNNKEFIKYNNDYEIDIINTKSILGNTESVLTSNDNYLDIKNYSFIEDFNYLVVIPNWELALGRVTQISAIGDVLYTVYHSYIYIVSIILLLGMIGAIILTGENHQEVKVLTLINKGKEKIGNISFSLVPFLVISESTYSESIIGNLLYFIIANIIIGVLFLFINSYFSLSVKYLDKGGGFECGFTSFVQTRERFNVIFYRVSLLFLVFDLEIILVFPYTALYQKNQNISKNNILAFLYILIIGFIYELKEGALNIVKKNQKIDV
jgi:NADH:ubiquinone oxidoreductase subunit 3 (subunit A)/NADH:ubiquinone oxidoreductase subunit 6 (subunit J)